MFKVRQYTYLPWLQEQRGISGGEGMYGPAHESLVLIAQAQTPPVKHQY